MLTCYQVGDVLKPALVVLKDMYVVYQNLEMNKRKFGDLIGRSARVVMAIDSHLKLSAGSTLQSRVGDLVKYVLVTLESALSSRFPPMVPSHLRSILSIIERWRRLTVMKTLLRRDEVSDDIMACHRQLTDCLTIFSVRLSFKLRKVNITNPLFLDSWRRTS